MLLTLFLFVLSIFSAASYSKLNLYVNNMIPSSEAQQDGTKEHPFSSLLQTLQYIRRKPLIEWQMSIFLAPSTEPYKLNTLKYTLTSSDCTSMEILPWQDFSYEPPEGSLQLKTTLDFTDSTLEVQNFVLFKVSNLELITKDGYIKLISSNLELTNINFLTPLTPRDSFISMTDGNVVFSDIYIDLSYHGTLLNYSSPGPETSLKPNIDLNNINIVLNRPFEYKDSNVALFLLSGNKETGNDNVNIKGLNFKASDDLFGSLVLETFFEIKDFTKVNFENFELRNLALRALMNSPLLKFERINTLNIAVTLENNDIVFYSTGHMMRLSEIKFLHIKPLKIIGNKLEQAFESPFIFLHLEYIQNLDLTDQIIASNTVTFNYLYIIFFNKFVTKDHSLLNLKVSNLNITNNINERSPHYFSYLNVESLTLGDVQVEDVEYSHNKLSGRIFFFQTKSDLLDYGAAANQRKFSRIKIAYNPHALDISFIYLFPTSNYLDLDDCLHVAELDALIIEDFQVINNSFSKGLSQTWTYEPSLIQVKQTQVRLDRLSSINNVFESFNFLSLDIKPSSLIMTASTVRDNNLTNSKFVSTNYLRGFSCAISGNNIVTRSTPLYRYGFILDSKFISIRLVSSTLLALDNGFIAINNTNFTNVFLVKQSFLLSNKFSPLPLLPGHTHYERDLDGEKSTLSDHTLAYKIFEETIEKATKSYIDPVYFYCVTNSGFQNITNTNSKMISLYDFSGDQSFIHFENNRFNFIKTEEQTTDPLIEVHNFHSLEFSINNCANINGNQVILSLSQGEIPSSLTFKNNSIKRSNVTGIVNFNGKSIEKVNFFKNSFKDLVCGVGCISIIAEKAYGDWVFDENIIFGTYIGNLRGLGESLGLITFISQTQDSNFEVRFIDNKFESIWFLRNQAEGDLLNLKVAQSILLNKNKKVDVFSDSEGCLFNIQTPKEFSISDSNFRNVFQYWGKKGTIHFSAKKTTISNTTFSQIKNTAGPGLFLLNPHMLQPNIRIFNCTFSSVYSLYLGSILTLSGNTDLDSSGLVCFIDFKMYDIQVENIYDTTMLHMKGIACHGCSIKDSYFDINMPSTVLAGANFLFEKSSGEFVFENVQFSVPTDKSGPLIQILNSSFVVTVDQLNFDGKESSFNFALLDSGVFIIQNSQVKNIYLTKNSLINVVPASNQIPRETQVKVTLKNTTMKNILLNITTPFGNSGLINLLKNSNALDLKPMYQAVLFSVLPIELSVQNCNFETIGLPLFLFGATGDTKFKNKDFIQISGSKFTDLSAFVGPVLLVVPVNHSPTIYIKNSVFKGNKAFVGACMFIYNASFVISNTSFLDNEAKMIGAAIFTGGSASNKDNQLLLKDVAFINNIAPYPGDIRSEAVDIKLSYMSKIPSGIQVIPSKDTSVSLSLSNVSSLELQQGWITIEYIDNQGNPTPDFSMIQQGTLEFPHNKQFKYQTVFTAYLDPLDELSSAISLTNVLMVGQAHETIQFALNFSSERIKESKNVSVDIRSCFAGEHNKSFTCQPCLSPTFSTDPSKTCETCPSNAHCPGQAKVCPLPGFWSTDTNSTKIIPCRNDTRMRCSNEDCHGCTKGYSGPLCEACDFENLYVETGYLTCGKCQDESKSLMYSIIGMVGFTLYQIFSIFTLYSANKTTFVNQSNFLVKRRIERSFYIKSLLTYTQLMSIIYVGASNVFKNIGLLPQVGDPASLIVYGTQCSMKALGIHYDNFMYYQTYFVMISPAIQFIGILAMLLLAKTLIKSIPVKKIMIVTILYLIISHQPGIVGNVAQFLSCKEVDGIDYKYVAAHAYWSCNDPRYANVSNFIAIPSLFVWCSLIPILIFSVLYLKRNKLKSEDVSTSIGVLIFDFEEKYYYWGIIVMILKLSLVFFSYGLDSKDEVQIFLSLIILWGYQSLVRKLKPYKYKSFNTFEITSMNLLLFNIIVAKYLIDPSNGSKISTIFVIVSLILNGGFLTLVLWKVLSLTLINVIANVEKLILKRKVSHIKDYRDLNVSDHDGHKENENSRL